MLSTGPRSVSANAVARAPEVWRGDRWSDRVAKPMKGSRLAGGSKCENGSGRRWQVLLDDAGSPGKRLMFLDDLNLAADAPSSRSVGAGIVYQRSDSSSARRTE